MKPTIPLHRLGLVTLGLALTSCVDAGFPDGAAGSGLPTADGQTCNASAIEPFVGEPAEAARSQLRTASGTNQIRLVAPGEFVTQDFIPGRLTVQVDEAGRILSARCG